MAETLNHPDDSLLLLPTIMGVRIVRTNWGRDRGGNCLLSVYLSASPSIIIPFHFPSGPISRPR